MYLSALSSPEEGRLMKAYLVELLDWLDTVAKVSTYYDEGCRLEVQLLKSGF